MTAIRNVFDMEDEQYWKDLWLTRKSIQRELMRQGQEGLLLGAPSVVGLDKHGGIPIAMLRVGKVTTLQKTPFKGNVIITAVNLATGQVYSALVAERTKISSTKFAPAKSLSPDSFTHDNSAMMSEGHTLDLVEHFGLTLMRAEYLVSLSLHDQVSNRCLIKVTDSSGYDDPVVDAFFVEQITQRLKTPKIHPRKGENCKEVSYSQSADSPALPVQKGIELSAPRVTSITANTQCMIHGSYRLAIKPYQSRNDENETGIKGVTAVVPITLILTGVATTAPKLISLGIPCLTPLIAQDGGFIATGYFSFDLCELEEIAIISQTYFVYLYSGLILSEPKPVAFVELPQEPNSNVNT